MPLEQLQQKHPQVLDQEKWGNYTFSRESFAKASKDSLEFIADHYEEAGQFQDVVPLDPDWDGMFYYEAKGQLLSFALRLADGKMIGYAMFILTPTLHAKSTMHAISDALYIVPKYRKSIVGGKFLQYIDKQLKQSGAKVAHMILKAIPESAFVEREGYKIFEVTYMKVL